MSRLCSSEAFLKQSSTVYSCIYMKVVWRIFYKYIFFFCKVQLCILYTNTLFQSKGGWGGGGGGAGGGGGGGGKGGGIEGAGRGGEGVEGAGVETAGNGGKGDGDNINYLVKIITDNKVFHFLLRNWMFLSTSDVCQIQFFTYETWSR